MSENIKAFPCPDFRVNEGMDLRDWFAGQALKAILADYLNDNNQAKMNAGFYAEEAYEIADEMMKQRGQ